MIPLNVLVRQLRKKTPPHRGRIPFVLYIVLTDLKSIPLDVDNLQITYKDLPTRFSFEFLKFEIALNIANRLKV